MSQLIALGLITAASALYGFVAAHYAFGRSLWNQVLWQVEYRARTWGREPRMGIEEWMASIIRFQGRLGLFLASASVAFLLSLTFNIVFVFLEAPVWLLAGTLTFLVLVALAVGWFIYVGVTNYRDARSRLRGMRDFVKEFTRKYGTAGGPPDEDS